MSIQQKLPTFASIWPKDHPDRTIKLPVSAIRRQPLTYAKLITKVRRREDGLCFEGPLFRPGECVRPEQLGERPVLLECAGYVGQGRGHHRRQVLYVLWRYDNELDEWVELGRAQALDTSWTLGLRDLAREALVGPPPALVDIYGESDRIVGVVVGCLDEQLEWAIEPVKARSLNVLYEHVAAQIAHCGSHARALRKVRSR